MTDQTHSEPSQETKDVPGVTGSLDSLNTHLSHHLDELKSLGPSLTEALHHDYLLPDREDLRLAARSIDLLHELRMLLEPPVLILADHFLGYVRSKCLATVVEKGIADELEKGPRTLNQLARATHTREDRLGQVMRMLYSEGVFIFDSSTGCYSNNAASSLMRSHHWTQWHNWATLYGNQFYDIARGIPSSVNEDTIRTAAQIHFDTDKDMFHFFREQGWLPELHRTLSGGASAQMPGILEDYPWYEVAEALVMDVGGGGGGFIAGLLRKYPTMQGGIFDLAPVINHVRPFFHQGGQYSDIGDRVSGNLVTGDFFKSVPRCSIYTMKWCLHDWEDNQATAILKNIRESIVIEHSSRLIILESVVSSDHSNRLSLYGDINMMMTAGGRERTVEQWENLARVSGWRLDKVWDLRRAWVKAIDFRPAFKEDKVEY
ncbi:S-adenosyl-L-methionine-dependent methyltransferase [Daldinia decipiens]|uniref:S-adenosyl-L-methionine-dependent methyltransferase n=1 Tax=Daldinia decipiens TaxID=326647 RepID=UPI0020C360ED|nr:S-adenosyl-L-methionine-dependent methyltransferase [Daldinia decipiens]KAI1653941.1 S-adenosyl-L-methionine-dependent methyltransferase [Daldinia decipiens]